MSSIVQRESIINAMLSYHSMLVDMTKNKDHTLTLEALGEKLSDMKLLIQQERFKEQIKE